ncbi:MAG: hypothetical protein Q9221_002994 [Calogaya cf. arnoldii]
MKERTERGTSIYDVIRDVGESNGAVLPEEGHPVDVKQGTFNLLEFLIMLFEIPKNFSKKDLFLSKPVDDPLIFFTQKPLDDTKLALGVLIAGLGVFIPFRRKQKPKSMDAWPPKQPESMDLSTSVLNVYALINIGKLKIECIMDIWNQPQPALAAANRSMFREALLSYRLLFGQTLDSRQLFNSQDRKRASKGGFTDRLLVQLYGHSKDISKLTDDNTFYEQAFYDSVVDFPHFGERLEVLQKYVSAKKSRNIKDLWRDRRDPEKWVLLWIVLIFTVVTIVLSMVQIFLGAYQLELAQVQVRLAELAMSKE